MAWQRFATLGMGGGSEQTTLNGRKVEQHIVWAGYIGSDTKVLADDNVTEITSWAAPDGGGDGSYRFDISMCVELPHADGSDFTLAELAPYAQGAYDNDSVVPKARAARGDNEMLNIGNVGDVASMYMRVIKLGLSGECCINRFTGLRVYLEGTFSVNKTAFDAYAAAYEGFGQDHPGIVAQAIHDGLSPDNPNLGIVVSTWSITDADA